MANFSYGTLYPTYFKSWWRGAAARVRPTTPQRQQWVFRGSCRHLTTAQLPTMSEAEDASSAADIVLDLFLGSGSTLIAADKTGRVCRGVEIDPLYVDAIIRRYEAAIGKSAVLAETGETYEALAVRRSAKEACIAS
jgi:hypothetical protein